MTPLNTDNSLVSFLYELMRDHVSPGVIEKLTSDTELGHNSWRLTNGYLAQYAEELADRLVHDVGHAEIRVQDLKIEDRLLRWREQELGEEDEEYTELICEAETELRRMRQVVRGLQQLVTQYNQPQPETGDPS